MIVLDASVLIAYLDGTDALHEAADTLLRATIDPAFGASPLTLAEVLVGPARTGRVAAVQQALADLEVHEIPLPIDSAARLAHLRADTGLKMPDCCVILAAEDRRSRLASFDDRLVRAAEDRHLPVLGR